MRDAYLQTLISKENDRKFTELMFIAYATFATIGGEGGKTFAESAREQLEKLIKLAFPYQKTQDSKEKQAAETKLVEKIFNHFKLGALVPEQQAATARKESFFQKMLRQAKGE